jgi:hypothetical protein
MKLLKGFVAFVILAFLYQNCGEMRSAQMSEDASSLQTIVDPITGEIRFFDPQTGKYVSGLSDSQLAQMSAYKCTEPAARGTASTSFRRLTRQEIENTLADFLGSQIYNQASIQQAIAGIPEETPGDMVASFSNAHSFLHVQAYLSLADSVGTIVAGNSTFLSQVFGNACAQNPTVNCAQAFLNGEGARLMRRVPPSETQDTLLNLFRNSGGKEGLGAMLGGLILSPQFMFHLELGQDEGSVNGKRRLTKFEVASRLSYALTGSLPDSELFAAAKADQLTSLTLLKTHADRLLKSPGAQRRVLNLMDSWLETYRAADPNGTIATKQYNFSSAKLADEARQELHDFLTYMIFNQNSSLPQLMLAKIGFPKSQRMASVFGSQISNGNPVDLPNGHAGILIRPSSLMTSKLNSSPILRGVYVRKRLLCDDIPSPNFAIVQSRLDDIGVLDPKELTNRQIAEQATSSAACTGCHSVINPLGFALERYDAFGMKRTMEKVFNESGELIATHEINTIVESPQVTTNDDSSIANADALNIAIAGSDKFRACATEKIFNFYPLRGIASADSCSLAEMEMKVLKNQSVKDIFASSIVNEDIFWRGGTQ